MTRTLLYFIPPLSILLLFPPPSLLKSRSLFPEERERIEGKEEARRKRERGFVPFLLAYWAVVGGVSKGKGRWSSALIFLLLGKWVWRWCTKHVPHP